jgi:DNA-directed RNA polymerase subunit beta'
MITYYERYVVIQSGIKEADGINYLDFLTEEEYLDILETLPKENQYLEDSDPNKFIAKMGAEALWDLLSRLDLDELSFSLRHQAANETSQQRKAEALKRLKVIEGFRDANSRFENKPEWMIMKILPVIPPELRPLVPLDGGRFATSDLNDLYRRVIIRNNRLKRLMEIKAPEVILRNEKRMLQEAVDSLLDNTRRANAVKASGNRPLKSLSDMLKGKQGRFRQNLLGKRVDYSGRSVIVVGPTLKLNECGIPKGMASELFKPFIIRKLIERGIVKTVKSAKKIVDRKDPVIWEILENILKGHPVLLNRAPTLHRLGIQAFQPKLVEGKAIQLHPLVCTGFNADFDGDQMAVHVPLGHAAVLEAQILMLASHNILNPANGAPIAVPSQDMVLGLYYLTKQRKSTKKKPVKGEGLTIYSPEEAIIAYNEGRADLHAIIKMKAKVRKGKELVEEWIETTIGRVIFNQHVSDNIGFINTLLTKKSLRKIIGDMVKSEGIAKSAEFLDSIKDLGFHYAFRGGLSFSIKDVNDNIGFINTLLTKKSLRKIIGDMVKSEGIAKSAEFLDSIKDLGFHYAFRGGLSFSIKDVIQPDEKDDLIAQAKSEVEEIWGSYNMGFITDNERYNQVIDIWTRINSRVSDALLNKLANDDQGFNPIYMMLDSGARGSKEQIRQLGGMRGLMAKPQKKTGHGGTGEIIENPILSNFREGLSILEYFISTHGARKGLADTALKTADAGYLTRRLHDVAQDVVVNIDDCDTLRGLEVSAHIENDEVVESLYDRIVGRSSLHDIDDNEGNLLVEASGEITEDVAQAIIDAGIDTVEIRSVVTCEAKRGVCAKCYGRNLSTGRMVQIGETVGVVAAQSIGEPGTQLTLRTFHVGGIASNIASESEHRTKNDGKLEFDEIKTVSRIGEDGEAQEVIIGRSGEIRVVDPKSKDIINTFNIPYGSILHVKEGAKVKKGTLICNWDPYNAVILSDLEGKIEFNDMIEGVTYKNEIDEQTGFKEKVISESKNKKVVPAIYLKDKKGETIKEFNLPAGAHINVDEGDKIKSGQILAKIPRVIGKTGDITGGLPRVTELFEARNPSNPAVVSEIDGVVTYGGIKRGNREILIESRDGVKKKYLVSLSKHILVQDGDFVKAGTPLSDGSITPKDILAIEGPGAVQRYILQGIQEVYRLQGVKINDKHIEVIIRQMMQKVTIVDPGDTKFLEKEAVTKLEFKEQNNWIYDKKVVTDAGDSSEIKAGQIISLRKLRDENSILRRKDLKTVTVRDAVPATSEPLLMGITKASLSTESFMSAASFQETTKVLNEAAIAGKVDYMRGLKENVIVGHLIPAGTGMRRYEDHIVGSKEEYEMLMSAKEEAAMEDVQTVGEVQAGNS